MTETREGSSVACGVWWLSLAGPRLTVAATASTAVLWLCRGQGQAGWDCGAAVWSVGGAATAAALVAAGQIRMRCIRIQRAIEVHSVRFNSSAGSRVGT